MATLEQIAQEAGVSRYTVANVLKGRNKESWACTARRAEEIRAIALRLGYRPNAAAVATATGRTSMVALLLSTDSGRSQLPPPMLRGIHDALAARNLHLMVAYLPDQELERLSSTPKVLREWAVDGFLIDYTHRIPARMIELIRDNQLPAVWINSKQDTDCVFPDDYGAGAQATKYLLELGHREICYLDLSHSPDDRGEHYSAFDRFHGYQEAMRQAGLEPQSWFAFSTPGPQRPLRLRQMLEAPHAPTAFLGYGQSELNLAAFAATRLGLEVPRDLSLLTFGPEAEIGSGLRLSTMPVPEAEVGAAAVRLLAQKMEAHWAKAPLDGDAPADEPALLPPQPIPFAPPDGETCARCAGAHRAKKSPKPRQ